MYNALDITNVENLVRRFEQATIAREDWRHAEHLLVGLYYVASLGEAAALAKMRTGILNLLANGFRIDLEKEMPFHETMTYFWINAISRFVAEREGVPFEKVAEEMLGSLDKDLPLRFYSREVLSSDLARASYVPPDLAPGAIDPN